MVLRTRDLEGKTVKITYDDGVFFLIFDRVSARFADVTLLPNNRKAVIIFAQVSPYEDLETYARNGVFRNAVDFIDEGVGCFPVTPTGNAWTRVRSAVCL